jgi:hypothetical protein
MGHYLLTGVAGFVASKVERLLALRPGSGQGWRPRRSSGKGWRGWWSGTGRTGSGRGRSGRFEEGSILETALAYCAGGHLLPGCDGDGWWCNFLCGDRPVVQAMPVGVARSMRLSLEKDYESHRSRTLE